MPLPLGHTAIGMAICETGQEIDRHRSRLATLLMVTILANLPDIDIFLGLVVQGNANLFHRGPTHSLFFALLAGALAANLGRFAESIPRLGFPLCFSLVFSHVLADMVLTTGPVSLWWPFEVQWSSGFSGLGSVIHTVFFQSFQDAGLILGCSGYVAALRLFRAMSKRGLVPVRVPRRRK